MENKIFQLAKKLLALQEQGIGGEKENATLMLKRLMEKHKISIEDINGDLKKKHWFNYKIEQRKFFFQLVASVIGDIENYFVLENKKTRIGLLITDSEFIEINAKFDFYWKAYTKDIDIFYKAFIQQNQLYRKVIQKDEEESNEQKDYKMTEEDFRMLQMMSSLPKHTFHKQLSR